MKGISIIIAVAYFGLKVSSLAQNYVTPIRCDLTPPSPQSAQIVSVQSPQPDLLTGAVNINVPIYTIKVDGYELPVSLRYHSNGIKVFDDPAPLGYGWTLLPALRATRTVFGRPDDLYPFVVRNPLDDPDYKSIAYMCLVKKDAFSSTFTGRYDSEHDIITFALPDKTITRVIDLSSGSPKFVGASDAEYKVEASHDLLQITVTDPAGNIHVFGSVYEDYNELCSKTVRTAWALSQIILQSGRKITLNWSTATHPFFKRSWLGGHSFRDLRDLNAWNTAEVTPEDYECDNYEDAVFSRINETNRFLNLDKISFPGGSVEFNYSSTRNGPSLNEINVKSDSETIFSYALSYLGENSTLLKEIDGGERKVYRFHYNTNYGYDPFIQVYAQDSWGYFNNKPNLNLTPKMRIKTRPIPQNNEGFYKEVGDADRSIDTLAMQAMILTDIVWPTGGITQYSYETHKFPPTRLETFGEIHPDDDPYLSAGGGLRVKSVKTLQDSTDTNPLIIRFEYPLATVRGVPSAATFVETYNIIMPCPNFGKTTAIYSTPLRLVNIMPISDYTKYDTGATPLWYDKVTAIWPEGKTESYFADIFGKNRFCPNFEFGSRRPADMIYMFLGPPQLTEQITYKLDAQGYMPIETTQYRYTLYTGTNPIINYHAFREMLYLTNQYNTSPDFIDAYYVTANHDKEIYLDTYSCYCYSFVPRCVRLTSVSNIIHTESGDYSKKETYSYKKDTGLIVNAYSTTSEGKTSKTTVKYPEIGVDAVQNDMVMTNCLGLPVAEILEVGSAITEIKAEYVRTPNGVFRQKRLTKVLQDASSKNQTKDTVLTSACKFDSIGNVIKVSDADGIDVSWTWDSTGLYPISKTENGLVTTYEYKRLVGLQTLTTPYGMVSRFSYDKLGRLTDTATDGLGILAEYCYGVGPGKNHIKASTWISDQEKQTVIHHYDNLGHKKCSVDESSGMKQYFDYDIMGRCIRTSIPSTKHPETENDYEYALTNYEKSPRNMVISTIKAGEIWHNYNKSVNLRILTNESTGTLACPLYDIDKTSLTHEGNYSPGTLTVEEIIDENGHVKRTYKTYSGKTVMTEEGDGMSEMLRTRYVYDDWEHLRAILPPSVDDGCFSLSEDRFIMNCFEFTYDSCGRIYTKRKPGSSECDRTLYSRAGRVIAEHKASMGSEDWFLHFYDRCGRKVFTSKTRVTETQLKELQHTFSVAEYTGEMSGCGYSFTPSPPITTLPVFNAAYFDNYDFLQLATDGNFPTINLERPGLQTGTYDASVNLRSGLTRNPPLDTGYLTLLQYDDFGRIIRTDRHTAKGMLTDVFSYNRAGDILSTETTLNKKDGTCQVVTYSTVYDLARRPIQWTVKYGTETARANLTYGRSGKIAEEKFASNVKRTYEYDVHGWLTRINTSIPNYHLWSCSEMDATVSGPFYAQALPGLITEPIHLQSEKYTEQIHYADTMHPRYDGTASAHVSSLGGRYDYRFDKHDRLIQADYTKSSASPSDEDFSAVYSYNAVAAPTTITRYGINGILIGPNEAATEKYGILDDITFDWDGMLLCATNNKACGEDFYGRTGYPSSPYGDDDFIYWNEAGLLTSQSSRNIADIAYNWAGHPDCIVFSNGDKIDYTYTTDGTVESITTYRKVKGSSSFTASSVRTYVGPFVFDSDSIAMVNFGAGYFDGNGHANYRHCDWQGNVSMVTDCHGYIIQHTGYYPYGEPWREPSGQSYLYGGKERQRDYALMEYDFSARRLYSPLSLWTTPDPEAATFPNISPYVYACGNPVKYIDPTGKKTYLLQRDGSLTVQATPLSPEEQKMLKFGDNAIKIPAGSLHKFESGTYKLHTDEGEYQDYNYTIYSMSGSTEELFVFLAENSDVEFSRFSINNKEFISTSHSAWREGSISKFIQNHPEDNGKITQFDHSHPIQDGPSKGDVDTVKELKQANTQMRCRIYIVPPREYILYDENTHGYTYNEIQNLKDIVITPK